MRLDRCTCEHILEHHAPHRGECLKPNCGCPGFEKPRILGPTAEQPPIRARAGKRLGERYANDQF